jgi:hypothetical protein
MYIEVRMLPEMHAQIAFAYAVDEIRLIWKWRLQTVALLILLTQKVPLLSGTFHSERDNLFFNNKSLNEFAVYALHFYHVVSRGEVRC